MDTATFPPSAPAEVWLSHPLVSSIKRLLPTDAPAVVVLEKLMEALHELDDRFPGMRLSAILTKPDDAASVRRTRAEMVSLGISQADIDLVAPEPEECWQSDTEMNLSLARSGLSAPEIVERYSVGLSRAKRITWLRRPLDQLDLQVARRVGAGESQRSVALDLKLSSNTVRWAMLRYWFHHPQETIAA